MKKIFLLILSSCLLEMNLFAQSSFCGVQGEFPNALAGVPNAFLNNSGPYSIRIFVHVVRNSSGTNGLTQTEVNNALNILSSDFAPHNICFSLLGQDNINNNDFMTWGDNCAGGPSQGPTDDNDFEELTATNTHTNAIDIYLMPNNIYNQGQANGIPGSALVIGGTLTFNGVTTNNLAVSHVFSHEMGHCLGLFHTFHGTCTCERNGLTCSGAITGTCAELVNGSNGTTCGDFVQDSPADPVTLFSYNLGSGCVWNNTTFRDANNQLYNPDETLIMSYTYPQCMQMFSTGQGQRMRDHIANSTILQARTVPLNVFIQNRSFTTDNILFASLQSVTAGSNVTTGTQGSVSFTSTARGEFRTRNFVDLQSGFNAQPLTGGVFFTTLDLNFCNSISQNNSALVAHYFDTYSPFLNKSEWLSTIQGFEGFISSRYQTVKDTIINGLIYKKITQLFVKLPGINADPSITENQGSSIFVREDIANKKVWQFFSGDTGEVILYDFELQIGQLHPTMTGFAVSTLDTVMVYAGVRKRITFSNLKGEKIIWIEGIGNISDPFSPGLLTFTRPGLICSYQNGKKVYDKGSVLNLNCDALLTSTSAPKPTKELSIYPNPTGGEVFITFNGILNTKNIKVYDSVGRRVRVFSEVEINGTYLVDLTNLPSGVYFIQIQLPEEVITKKLQKQ